MNTNERHLRQIPTTPLRMFTYTDHKLVTEVSTLGSLYEFFPLFDDATDVGIAIESPTGRIVHFYFDSEHRDNEGDLMFMRFLPVQTDQPVREVVVFND